MRYTNIIKKSTLQCTFTHCLINFFCILLVFALDSPEVKVKRGKLNRLFMNQKEK